MKRFITLEMGFQIVIFRAGEFLEQTSDGSDINYLGTMLTFRF